jgi:hypothetical protein
MNSSEVERQEGNGSMHRVAAFRRKQFGVRRTLTSAVLALALAVISPSLSAQWPPYPTTGVPKTLDGKPDLNAPAPRTADGKPDLSGVWETTPCVGCAPPVIDGLSPPPAAGRGGGATAATPPRSVFGNIGANLPGGAPYQPWAADLVKKRMADNSKDNPDAHCLPMGIMQLNSHPYPKKIIQTPAEVVLIYEGSGTTVRELFLDGRPLPKDAEPWWHGYSSGRWEGDTFVVETSGFMDDGWLDVRGSPLTSAGKITERFRRLNYGYLEIAVTIDDAKAYTAPFTVSVYNRIMLDTQLSEFVCIDKDAQHYVGADHNK